MIMKAVVQRVRSGNVSVDGNIVGKIGQGYVVLLGVKSGDMPDDARRLAYKTANLRIFSGDDDKMNLSIKDIQGEVLVISQFTLYADTKKGHRPSFSKAARPKLAEELYEIYATSLRHELGDSRVATGVFGAMMLVNIANDGPVTIELTSPHEPSV